MAKPKGMIANPFAEAADTVREKDALTPLNEMPIVPLVRKSKEENAGGNTAELAATAYGMERASNVVMIPWDVIEPDEKNFFAQKDIEALAENIAEIGLQHNLVVRPIGDGRFKIISGHRRWAACKYISQMGNSQFDKILCQVLEVDELDSEIMLIYDNNQTRTVSPMERVQSVRRLTALIEQKRKRGGVKGKTRDLVAEIIGMSGMEVQRIIRVGDNLLPELQTAMDSGIITFRSAVELAGKPIEAQEKVMAKIAASEVLSTVDVAKIVAKVEAAQVAPVPVEDEGAEQAVKWLAMMGKALAMVKKLGVAYAQLAEADAVSSIEADAAKLIYDADIALGELRSLLGAADSAPTME
jgi:ParB/RepB/Spo0J family partition protein